MIRALAILGIFLIPATYLFPLVANADSSPPQIQQESEKQWRSHQMNQPPPATPARYKLSKRAISDIAMLYEMAKKEAETDKTTTE